jgi:hypothetical protein
MGFRRKRSKILETMRDRECVSKKMTNRRWNLRLAIILFASSSAMMVFLQSLKTESSSLLGVRVIVNDIFDLTPSLAF